MKVTILEIGHSYDAPDITRVFSSIEKAKENIPPKFKSIGYDGNYADEVLEKWLSIKEYEVE